MHDVLHDLASSVAREIQRARDERAFLRDRLAEAEGKAADLWARALVAETPLADRAFREARDECGRIRVELDGVEARLVRLAGRSGGPAGPSVPSPSGGRA